MKHEKIWPTFGTWYFIQSCSFLFFQLLLNETRFFLRWDNTIQPHLFWLEISRRYRFWWSWNVCMNIIICFNKWSVNLWHHSFTDTSVPLFEFVCGSLNMFNENCHMKRWAAQNTFITYLKVLWFFEYLFIYHQERFYFANNTFKS